MVSLSLPSILQRAGTKSGVSFSCQRCSSWITPSATSMSRGSALSLQAGVVHVERYRITSLVSEPALPLRSQLATMQFALCWTLYLFILRSRRALVLLTGGFTSARRRTSVGLQQVPCDLDPSLSRPKSTQQFKIMCDMTSISLQSIQASKVSCPVCSLLLHDSTNAHT